MKLLRKILNFKRSRSNWKTKLIEYKLRESNLKINLICKEQQNSNKFKDWEENSKL